MPSTSSCPHCHALLDTSEYSPGSRLACADCGKPFVVGDTPRSAAPLESRPYPGAERVTASGRPPVAPRAVRSVLREPEGDSTGRWVAFGICLFFLVVVLGGVGYLVLRAGPGGGWGSPTTMSAPFLPKADRKDREWQEERMLEEKMMIEEKMMQEKIREIRAQEEEMRRARDAREKDFREK